MNLDIPELVMLSDGTMAPVMAVAAKIIDGRLGEVIYTVEMPTGAWRDVAREAVRPQGQSGIEEATKGKP